MKIKLALFTAVLAAAAPGALAAPPPQASLGSGPAGFSLTIEVPPTYRAGVPVLVQGRLLVYASLVLYELGHPVPSQDVRILVGGSLAATARTNDDGIYTADLMFDAQPPTTRTLRAVAFTGTPVETSSPDASTSLEQIWQRLVVEPSSASVGQGGTVQLRAQAEDGDGRLHDVTEQATWTTSDAAVATVSNAVGSRGLVTGGQAGGAIITASFDALSSTASVTVS